MRRDKNGFMILNKQSIRPDIEPIDRLTNSSPTIAASFDLLERPGQQYGRDFRGERVLAFGTAIEGSQWKLVAKIDEAEIYEHINNLAMVVGVALATMAVMGCIGWAAHNRHVLISHQQHVDSIMLAKRIDYLARYATDCIVVCDAHGNILEVNNRCLSTYGYDLAEMQGMPAIELLSPECRNDQATIMERLFHERRLLFETMHCRKDGTTFPVEVSACLIEFEGVLCLQEIIRDISERRRIEDQRAEYVRHITEASSRFLTVQEQERRILARELHDKTGANLSAITLNLKALSNALPDTVVRKCKRLLDDINELLINTVVDLRHICSELRPAMLDYADLKDALLDLAASFAQRTGIAAHVDLDAFDGQCPTDTASLLFRIVQEALTNCAKHSDARNVDIRLANSEGTAVLVVTDDGKGFSPELFGQTEHKPGLGLLMIKERVEFLGGRFTVNSSPGAGTEIKVEWQMIFGPQSASSPIELELARVRLSRVA